jgi:ABC-type polysaccharide/polyol phosphate export permease
MAFSLLGALLWGRKAGLNIDVLIGYMVFSTMISYLQSANSALLSTVNLGDSGLPISVRFLKGWAKDFLLSLIPMGILVITAISLGTFNVVTFIALIALNAYIALWGLGLMFVVAPAALRFRDLGQLINFLITILIFFTPIFWKIQDIKNKEIAKNLLTFNPIADFIYMFRSLINIGVLDMRYLAHASVHVGAVVMGGLVVFIFTRRRIPYWS